MLAMLTMTENLESEGKWEEDCEMYNSYNSTNNSTNVQLTQPYKWLEFLKSVITQLFTFQCLSTHFHTSPLTTYWVKKKSANLWYMNSLKNKSKILAAISFRFRRNCSIASKRPMKCSNKFVSYKFFGFLLSVY